MSKQATPPPPGDKPKASAPPPPPTWRNWLWPIMIVVIFGLFYLLPHALRPRPALPTPSSCPM